MSVGEGRTPETSTARPTAIQNTISNSLAATRGFGSYCKREENIGDDTKYTYLQYLQPRTNDIKNESVIHNISSLRFLDWSDRAKVDAWVNDTQDNVSFTSSDNGIAVTIQDGYSNSSVHKDILYETRVEYENTGGSDGSDDSDDSDDEKNTPNWLPKYERTGPLPNGR